MAWPVQLPSGRYQGRYRDVHGKEQTAGTFQTDAQALREAARKESEARDPGAVDIQGGKIPWGRWFDEWNGARFLAYSTDENYRSVAANHVMPTWEHTRLMDIQALDIHRWVKSMLRPKRPAVPKSPWVVRSALMLFKTSLNAAVDAKRLVASEAKGVPYPDLPEGLERYLTPDEVENIAFELSGSNALLLWLGVQTGMRFGEMAGLHWNRVDLQRGVIQVVEKFDQKAYVIDPLPKDKEQRTIPLPADLVGLLTRYRENRVLKPTCGIKHVQGGKCAGDILFRGARGAPLKSNDWGKTIWKKALLEAGIEGRVRPHDMRHTFASWLIQEGVGIAEVARVMGHSDIEVTQRYAHLSDAGFDTVREALDRRRGVLGAAPEETVGLTALEQRLAALEALFVRTAGSTAGMGSSSLRETLSMIAEQAG